MGGIDTCRRRGRSDSLGLSAGVAWWVEPKSTRFALQMLVTVAAAVVAAPHSHLHGITLLFAPLALAIARRSWECLPVPVWYLFCAAGFLLTWVGWLLVPLRWLLAPYLLVSAVGLTLWLLSEPRSRGHS